MIKVAAVVFVVLAGGCYVGAADVRNMPAAVDRQGAHGVATVGKTAYRGELLTVKDSSLIIRTDSARVVQIPIGKARIVQFKPFVNERGGFIREEHLTRLRRASRFPFGIPENALADILAASKSSSVEVIEQ